MTALLCRSRSVFTGSSSMGKSHRLPESWSLRPKQSCSAAEVIILSCMILSPLYHQQKAWNVRFQEICHSEVWYLDKSKHSFPQELKQIVPVAKNESFSLSLTKGAYGCSINLCLRCCLAHQLEHTGH